MPDLHPMVQHGDLYFDEYMQKIGDHRLPQHARQAWAEANDAMTFARALAKAHFGREATPDHAAAIFQAVMSDIARRARALHTDTE
ncbi:hypothetical protein C7H84_33840 [Burkholderia sp. Nafp2/4-1b]|nr:hypothetical protein C7H84_33840 [Burkholderia sp. Nafp2/4-1b]